MLRFVASKTFKPSVLSARFMSHGLVDKELTRKLKDEISYEAENAETPKFLNEYNKNGTWQILDKSGSKEVVFKRTFGNENISVFVSTDALTEADYQEEVNEQEEEAEVPAGPIPLTVLVEKGETGTVEIAATVDQEVGFFIENVSFYKSSEVAADPSSEGDWKRKGLYGGPAFNELDAELIDTFQNYLEERGFDQEFSEFVPLYLEYKEQNEYKRWLQDMADFVAK